MGGLPARASLRYRGHSRSCAFHAVLRSGLGRHLLPQQLFARLIRPGRAIAPGGLDEPRSCCTAAGLGDFTLAARAAAGVLGGCSVELRQELGVVWRSSATDLAAATNAMPRSACSALTTRVSDTRQTASGW